MEHLGLDALAVAVVLASPAVVVVMEAVQTVSCQREEQPEMQQPLLRKAPL